MTQNANDFGGSHLSRKQILAWSVPALVLGTVAIAMQFTKEINWTVFDFFAAGFLLYGSLGAYAMVSRLSADATVRAAFGFGIGGALLLLWANGAVGLTDSDADAVYIVVVMFAILGSFFVRFRPRKMALIMNLTAVFQALVGIIALLAGMVPLHNAPLEIIGIAIFFGAAFLISAALFRKAALESGDRSAM